MGSDRRPVAGLGAVLGVALLASTALKPPSNSLPATPRAARIGVLVSEDSQPGHLTIDGFRKLLETQVPISSFETYQLEGYPARAEAPLQRARQGDFDLILQ